MAAKKKESGAAKLEKDITAYFSGISRLVTVKENKPTGKKDSYGHDIYELASVTNRLGKVVKVEEWLIPPSIPDLLHQLELTQEQWDEMKKIEGFRETCEAAERRVERYLRRELLTRPNKEVKGVMLTLQRDFGFAEIGGGEAEEGSLEDLLGGGGA